MAFLVLIIGITFQPSLKENQQQKATKTPVTLQKPIHNNYTAHGKKSLLCFPYQQHDSMYPRINITHLPGNLSNE